MLKQKINMKLIFIVLFSCLKVSGTKYKYNCSTFHDSCEKCEEKSKLFYEMKKKKFCPRCTLGQLSFFFPSYTMEEVKFYMTDILFDQINKINIKKTKCTSWSNVNQLVSDKINNESQILEKRKKSNQSFDFFTIVNEILKKFNKEPLKKRKCLNCSMIPKDISKLYDDKSYVEKYLFRPSFRSIIANILVNTFLQKIVLIYLFETNFDLKSYFWDMANFSLVNFIVNQQHTDLDDDIPPELLAKIIFTINECAKIIITWLNILLGYFTFGEPLQEVSKLMFVTGISFSALSCALVKVKHKLLFDVKKELNYKFL